MAAPRTLFDKIWDSHVIAPQGEGTYLIYIDLHLIHEVTTPQAFEGLKLAGRKVRRPDATMAVADHNIPTTNRSAGVAGIDEPDSKLQVDTLERNVKEFGVPYFPITSIDQGIVHIIGPEQGLSQPGMTIVCGDSHTATHGAMGALAFGIGTSEVEHVLATQTLIQAPAKNMLIEVNGALGAGVSPKDVILAIIAKIGTAGGTGHVFEYAGSTFRDMSMEGRMTVCNMSIEAGARAGLVAPDDKTIAYVMGRPYAPKGAAWEQAVRYWRTLPSDPGAKYDKEAHLDAADIAPHVTWGTNPEQAAADHRPRPRPGADRRPAEAGGDRARAAIHAAAAEHAADRGAGAARLHRLVHQQPDRGSARRRGDRQGPQGRRRGRGAGRAGLRPRQAPGRGGRARPRLPRSRVRMARRRLLDVHVDEQRQGDATASASPRPRTAISRAARARTPRPT